MDGLRGEADTLSRQTGRFSWKIACFMVLTTWVLGPSTTTAIEAEVKRAVLGTVLTADKLDIARRPGAWEPGGQGTPVLEDSYLRTQSVKPALLGLGTYGLVSLRNESSLKVGKIDPDGLPLTVGQDSEVSFRIPAQTGLYFLTDSAVVRALEAAPGTGEDAYIQGVIRQQDGETVVSVLAGSLRVRNRDGKESVLVAGGEEVSVAGPAVPPERVEMASTKSSTKRRLVAFGWLGTKTGMIAAGATAAAVGGGIAAASSSGGGSSSTAAGSGGGQASPFVP